MRTSRTMVFLELTAFCGQQGTSCASRRAVPVRLIPIACFDRDRPSLFGRAVDAGDDGHSGAGVFAAAIGPAFCADRPDKVFELETVPLEGDRPGIARASAGSAFLRSVLV